MAAVFWHTEGQAELQYKRYEIDIIKYCSANLLSTCQLVKKTMNFTVSNTCIWYLIHTISFTILKLDLGIVVLFVLMHLGKPFLLYIYNNSWRLAGF